MNKYDFADRIVVITGGAQGIGYATAQKMLANGAKVILWDLDIDRATASAKTLSVFGDCSAVRCDVSDYTSVIAARDATVAAHGHIDVVVNSAGIAGPNASVEDYDNDAWAQILAINLTGTYHVNKAVVGGMRDRNYGRIVNIASVAGKEGNPNASAYSASKAGVIAFTKSLGKEMAGYDIAVNCITPAAARTAIFDQMAEEFIQFMLTKIPRGRFVEVEEIANMACWMASAENSFTTGAAFDISGGRATY
jgi:NAD(P)-dependent dehydrogenase (short-subunit alcohol dehydrogenase family)